MGEREIGPQLTQLRIGDSPQAWTDAGFVVDGSGPDAAVRIGNVSLVLTGETSEPRGVGSWAFDRETADVIDGVMSREAPAPPNRTDPHPNGVTGLDHVVMMSPNLGRTTAALQSVGFEARHTRDYEMRGQALRQVFFWMGDVILELAGPVGETGPGPAKLWGLAFTCPDLDETVRSLGPELCSEAREAVQPGRRIASLRHKALNITVPVAFMTPHVTAS